MNTCFSGCIKTCKSVATAQCPRVAKLLALQVPLKPSTPSSIKRSAPGRVKVAGLQDIPKTNTELPKYEPVLDESYVVPPLEDWGKDAQLMAGCEPGKQLRVAVLLSGGVDSSLSLRLLKAAGHHCKAFYLQIWFQEDFRNFWDSCPWETDLEFARKVCASLGVELEVVPMTQDYWNKVVSHSVQEIREGRTPNPDMLCNSRVKFGAFYDYLEQHYGSSFDRVASGHYARVLRASLDQAVHAQQPLQQQLLQQQRRDSNAEASFSGQHNLDQHFLPSFTWAAAGASASHTGRPQQQGMPHQTPSSSAGHGPGQLGSGPIQAELARLALTPDAVKDQTYFLAHLSPAQLARTMFPLGALTKPQVRKLAAAADLANKDRKDSQGICFLGKVKFHEFVREHLGEWPGYIVEAESGRMLGVHQGYWFYTVGQRGGIKLPGGPWYVVAKDMQMNVVFVSRQYYAGDKQRKTFSAGPFNWLSGVMPDPTQPLYCKVRHGPTLYRCSLAMDPSSDIGHVTLAENDQGLAPGQYAVFYQNGLCLGAAKIQDAPSAKVALAQHMQAAAAAASDSVVGVEEAKAATA